jgi:hypothetical protein
MEARDVAFNTAQNVVFLTDIAGAFVPVVGNVISAVSSITREILGLVERAEHNKRVCYHLAERIRVATDTLRRGRFQEDTSALQNYKVTIERARDFVLRISRTSTFMRVMAAREVRNTELIPVIR